MAAKKAAPAARARTRVVVAKPASRRRRKKSADKIDSVIAGGVGWIAPDVLAVVPGLGPWLQRNPQIPPALVAAALAFVGGRLAGGQWKEAGKYAALGALAQYVLRRAAEVPKTAGLAGTGDQSLLDARELFEQIDRALPARAPEPVPAARVRRIGELAGR